MSRKLIATLAVRNEGSRLYGKPLQNLDIENGITILDHMVNVMRVIPAVTDIVLGIAEGSANTSFIDFANSRGLRYIIGSEKDVLGRLIDCAEAADGTDALRVTTESPFFHFPMIQEAWNAHVENKNDVTVIDEVPEGSFFEIFSLDALRRSHTNGNERHRSELVSLYIRENLSDFRIECLPIYDKIRRIHDLRLTVDYPEDLIVCREVYMHLRDQAPQVYLEDIIDFLDDRPDLKNLVSRFICPTPLY